MARRQFYPEGTTTINVVVPNTVKEGLDTVATRTRQSRSQLVSVICEDWLRRRGDFPEAEPEIVGAH